MNVRSFALFAIAATLAVSLAAPGANAHHCDTKLNVYGRTSVAPAPPPPYLSLTAGICVRVFQGTVVDDHVLPPNTDQVMVRVNGDFGTSIPTLLVKLYGLGFENQTYTMYRVANNMGPYSYQLADWVSLPFGAMDGNLVATAYYPSGPVSVTYKSSNVPVV